MSEKAKRKNPYQMLMEDIQTFVRKVRFRRMTTMWIYPKDKLSDGWPLKELYERTAAAAQLGYDVMLAAQDDGLYVRYVKKVPEAPSNFRD